MPPSTGTRSSAARASAQQGHFVRRLAASSLFMQLGFQATYFVGIIGCAISTLVVITVIAVACLVVMAMLEVVRSRLLVRMSVSMDKIMSLSVLAGMIRKTAFGGEQSKANLRDVMTMRQYLAGNAIFAFFDGGQRLVFTGRCVAFARAGNRPQTTDRKSVV